MVKKKEKKVYETTLDMTPMIDCVFQLMIFFVVTIQMDNDQISEKIKLAKSPHGPAIEKKVPGTMIIQLDKDGNILMGKAVCNEAALRGIIGFAVNRIGASQVSILIRADSKTKHYYVRRVMDICTEKGIWKIQFAAMKRKGA